MPAVSVVIPAYKSSPFIRATLESVFAQTHLPDEVVVVDDCSPDDTVAVVEDVSRFAPVPVRILRRTRNSGGPAAPMNEGVRAAHGEIVVLLDHDDLMTPQRIAKHSEGFVRPEVGFTFGGISRMDVSGNTTSEHSPVAPARIIALATEKLGPDLWLLDSARAYEDSLLRGAVIGASNVAFRKSLWAGVGGFSERHRVCWDYEFYCQATRHCRFAYIDTRLAWYRLHGGNLHRVSDRLGPEWTGLLRRHYAAPLWPIDRAALAAVIRQTHLDQGYKLSLIERPLAAAKEYTKSIRFGTGPLRVGRLSVKAFLRFARDRLIGSGFLRHRR